MSIKIDPSKRTSNSDKLKPIKAPTSYGHEGVSQAPPTSFGVETPGALKSGDSGGNEKAKVADAEE